MQSSVTWRAVSSYSLPPYLLFHAHQLLTLSNDIQNLKVCLFSSILVSAGKEFIFSYVAGTVLALLWIQYGHEATTFLTFFLSLL